MPTVTMITDFKVFITASPGQLNKTHESVSLFYFKVCPIYKHGTIKM